MVLQQLIGKKVTATTHFLRPLFLLGGKTPLSNIAAVKIIEAQIPFSWYVFNDGNTKQNPNGTQWTLVETGGAQSGVPLYPLIDVGNYAGGPELVRLVTTIDY